MDFVGGRLALKGGISLGGAGKKKKKKKEKKEKKGKKDRKERKEHKDADAAARDRDEAEQEAALLALRQSDQSRAAAEAARATPAERTAAEVAALKARLTPSERRLMERQARKEKEDFARMAEKSHRETIQEYNKYLASLGEIHDIPKVGPG